jgi:hypothetical protein
MDFSLAYLGKSLDDLVYNDIEAYFADAKEESETIEFKSYHARATFDSGLLNVIRGISAFLNSSGGILIWGAPNGQKLQGHAEDVFVGELSPVTELHGRDRLINRITSAIVPLPIGINVKILDNNGQYIYVFEVQPSMYKPHQYDTRYYVRLDGQTKPAPHYLVDALMKQVTYPNLNGVIKFKPMKLDGATGAFLLPITVGIFNFSPLQNEELVSFRVLVVGGYFQRSRTAHTIRTRPHAYYNMNGHELVHEDFADIIHFGTPKTYNETLSITEESIAEDKGLLTLILTFGGKKSPAKTSSYSLDFRRNNITLATPNDLITQIEENLLFSELQQRINKTTKDSLDSFLERG